jgi:hypothetical protein
MQHLEYSTKDDTYKFQGEEVLPNRILPSNVRVSAVYSSHNNLLVYIILILVHLGSALHTGGLQWVAW